MEKSEKVDTPAWLLFERCAAAFAVENFGGLDATVVPNAKLVGVISGRPRQVDVLVDARWSTSAETRILFDAKHRKRKLDITDVEAFEGMMRDCDAQRGVLVTPSGWTSGAELRAQDAIAIKLLNLLDLEQFEFGFEPCFRADCRASSRKGQRGAVLWEEFIPSGFGSGWVIIQVGKCDRCRTFNVWCWDCGSKFSVPDGQVVSCGCEGREWASVPESEESGHVGEPTSIWLMAREYGGPPVAFDRKPI